jgi:alpha,alpha-trehalase
MMLKRLLRPSFATAVVALCLLSSHGLAVDAARARPQPQLQTPAELYGELFSRVQLERLFPDSKTFADALARTDPARIRDEYDRSRRTHDFDLRRFVEQRFVIPGAVESTYHTQLGEDLRRHIDTLWSVLERPADQPQLSSSLVPLPHRYVVPGGRFREIYYWDSYFTMLGLEQSGRHDLVVEMVKNFAYLIDRFGHVPNGNRTYYLSRSQPPFFASMVTLLAERDGEAVYRTYLPQLAREYEFWMDGAAWLTPGSSYRRVVRLNDGTLLNRYWDDRAVPREESYREDLETARSAGRAPEEMYRNLRAAAESGWDFSSRWFADGRSLVTIRTVDLVPVDLNSLLYGLEQTLARAYRVANDSTAARKISARAWQRRAAVQRLLWNDETESFEDYLWREGRPAGRLTAATLYPLFFGLASREQANAVASTVRERLLQPNGLATSTEQTGQQWDAPNGWAPLQWIAVKGLNDYGHPDLAREIALRWARTNIAVFRNSGKLFEKYNVSVDAAAAGGEYPNQDGFGWTNGVLRELLNLYPGVQASLQSSTPRVAWTTGLAVPTLDDLHGREVCKSSPVLCLLAR